MLIIRYISNERMLELYVVSQKASKKTSGYHSKKIRQFAENIYNISNHALTSGP